MAKITAVCNIATLKQLIHSVSLCPGIKEKLNNNKKGFIILIIWYLVVVALSLTQMNE